MQKKNENLDIWSEAAKRYRTKKINELFTNWQQERRAAGLPSSQSAFAEEINYHRNWISKILNGEANPPIEELCRFFKVDPSYFVAKNLDELDIMDEDHHRRMQSNSAKIASENGVSKSFLWYLKTDPVVQDIIVRHQSTDAILNSFDPDVPDVGSPYQFANSTGEKVYLNEYSLPKLARIESKVKEFIAFQIWNEFIKPDKNE